MPEPLNVNEDNQPSVDWLALAGVLVTIALHLILQSRKPNPIFIAGACLFWAGFVMVRGIRDPKVFRRWGFRSDNLLRASVVPAMLLIVGALGLGVFALWQGQFRLSPGTSILFVLYPIWGLAQQFLALGIAVQSMELLPAWRGRTWLLAVSGAALFGAVHAPDMWAVAGTFLLELVLVPVFLHFRNLWPLGVVHGWLGVLFYAWGQGRDMFAEGFGQ